MKQTIQVYELPPGLNKWQRMHHMKRHKVKQVWQWLIRAQKPSKHEGAVRVRFTRYSTTPMDADNTAASFKCVGDSLVKLGVIEDDSPDILQELTARWQKAPSRKDQRVTIEIEDVET